MAQNRTGIGDRYQQETKYTRESLSGSRLMPADLPEQFKQYPDAVEFYPLPRTPTPENSDFWEVLIRRRSERRFAGTALAEKDLHLLLFATQGITADEGGYLFRTAPSAGGLFPIETYVYVNHVTHFPQGLYHLNVVQTGLELLRRQDFSAPLTRAALGQSMVAESGATFIWSAVVDRSRWKYRERAYRYIYLDAGHIGQNLYLAATALGLGCCTIGAFFDDEVNRIIGVDGKQETAVYMGAVGTLT
jgi:SagB-type dehydrogenase family enzyme